MIQAHLCQFYQAIQKNIQETAKTLNPPVYLIKEK